MTTLPTLRRALACARPALALVLSACASTPTAPRDQTIVVFETFPFYVQQDICRRSGSVTLTSQQQAVAVQLSESRYHCYADRRYSTARRIYLSGDATVNSELLATEADFKAATVFYRNQGGIRSQTGIEMNNPLGGVTGGAGVNTGGLLR